MNNVLYPLTYLGLCPFMIVLARALQTQEACQPTFLAATPAEAAFAMNNLPVESLVIGLAGNSSHGVDVLDADEEYQSVYGFMKAKYGGSHPVWRQRVNAIYRLVERTVIERKITMMILWNGNDCMGKVCQILAAKYDLKTVYLENGYFPNTLQIDPQGVNAEASIVNVPAREWLHGSSLAQPLAVVQKKNAPIAPTTTVPLSFVQRMKLKLSAKLLPGFYDRYPELRDQKVKKQVQTPLELSSTLRVLNKKKPFALVVLQVHDDTQILLNSKLFNNPKDFLVHCYESVRNVYGPRYDIVVKLHPVDMDRICYADMAATMHGVSWIGSEPVQPLLDECAFVMVVNSSVGLQSIALHKPTLVFGESFYSRQEICRVVKSVDQTERHLNELKLGDSVVDSRAADNFLAFLHARYFVKGSWNLGRDSDLGPAVNRIHRILENSIN
ncbi:capsular polysaccharide export protein, LipB/KpsS family [Limnobacter parvus]|uniref:Capsular biosynthesis protein n=1 Tax=Limnobacter parvus TaxID=2939690 RepID=A0ABT1XF62_9BURK|nr:hypothetical protein [Limnobacter parvus]MCR2745912.1 hypothetical protein [Limnobacter parvus]